MQWDLRYLQTADNSHNRLICIPAFSDEPVVNLEDGLVYIAFNGNLEGTLAALRTPGVDVNETDPVSI